METKTFTAPKDFTDKFPKYIYRTGKWTEQVQWREAALDMANERAKLVELLRRSPQIPFSPTNNGERWDEGYKAGFYAALNNVFEQHQRLLRELGEEV